MLSAPAKLAMEWFGSNEKAIATSIGAVAVPLGCIIGFVMPTFFIKDWNEDPWTAEHKALEVKHNFEYMLVQNIVITILATPIIFIAMREKPPTPPSKEVTQRANDDSIPFFRSVCQLFTNCNYLVFTLCFSALYGVYMTLGAIVSLITAEFDYDASDNSIFGLCFLGSGLISSFVNAMLLDKYRRFRL